MVATKSVSTHNYFINYQGMVPILLNAIKEQQAQIDELKALIKK